MSFETQQTFLGKTQAFLVSEVRSEKLISWTRLGVGFAYVVLSLVGLLMGEVSGLAFAVGFGAVLLLCGSSAYYLLRTERRLVVGYTGFVLIFLDITVITTIIWAYSAGGAFSLFHTSFFCAYFIALIFTALHYRTSLVLFGAGLTVLEYSMFYFWELSNSEAMAEGSISSYLIQISVFLLVAALGIVISRNNLNTIQKVVSSEVRYQNLVHRLPEMLFTLDSAGKFIWANMAAYSILGIPAKALKGRNIREFMKQAPLKRDGGSSRGTFEIWDFEGNRKFVDCLIQPVDDGQSHASWEGLMTDVTDRELAISQREEMVNRLFQYQKMESLGTLASGMAHDFNNILQTITDITSMVESETNEENTQKRMKTISDTLVDARFLVSELLAFGRKTPLRHKPIDMQEFLTTNVRLFDEQIGEKYETILNIREDPLVIRGDADYLKRIFQNLFGNARDVMPEGGSVTVDCFAERQEGANGSVVVRFSDTGTGIPPDIAGKVFDPFFTTKKPGKGTGLGLALVQRIMSLHNGAVKIDKTGPAGTTFRLEFPEHDASDLEDDTKTLLDTRIPSRLLLLDDDPKIRDVLQFFLKEYGYQTCGACDADEALGALKKYQDDCNVLIMDWKLGDDDPMRVITDLRKVKPELIVIVVSGYPADQKSIEKLNIHKWFTKPYNRSQLDIEIQRALHRLQKS